MASTENSRSEKPGNTMEEYNLTSTDNTRSENRKTDIDVTSYNENDKTNGVSENDTANADSGEKSNLVTVHKGWFDRLREKKWVRILLLLIAISLTVADLVSDWVFYSTMISLQKGLVFGPPKEAIQWALLTVSILGTISFIIEIGALLKEQISGESPIHGDVTSAITIWIEEVPQNALNLVITLCRESAISYIQLVKASLLIVIALVRFFATIIRYMIDDRKYPDPGEHTKWQRKAIAVKTLISLGLLCVTGCSVAVYIFGYTVKTETGAIDFNVPTTIVENVHSERFYFNRVGIYLNHPWFDCGINSNKNWVNLGSIYDVINTGENGLPVMLSYIKNSNKLSLKTNSSMPKCFTRDQSCNITFVNCLTESFSSTDTFSYEFKYQGETAELLLGDITYMQTDGPAGSCASGSAHNQSACGTLRYFKAADTTNNSYALATKTTPNSYDFYKEGTDLIDITEIWKTGFTNCETTGALQPNRK